MKNHLYFRNPQEGSVSFKQKTRYAPTNTEEQEENQEFEVQYEINNEVFRNSIQAYKSNKNLRERRKTIELPGEIDLIWIKFYYIFDSSKFEFEYFRDFGLEIVTYKNWNTEAIFSIVDVNKFNRFINNLEELVNSDNNNLFNANIKFIKEFDFLSSNKRVDLYGLKENIFLDIIDSNESFEITDKILSALINYLKEKEIIFYYSENGNYIELSNICLKIIEEIINNFDIIYSINSYTAGVVRPNNYSLPEKGYGFEIESQIDDLPIIGIIDTGIEKNTPLNPIVLEDDSYNLTNSSVFTDEKNHGTAVAAIAALGPKLYPNHIGKHNADARLLSIKVMNNQVNFLFKNDVLNLIRKANKKYGVQIFTLTIGYDNYKKFNEKHSEYAIELDKLTHELNILIFISIGNNENYYNLQNNEVTNFPELYYLENSNLCSPAESMNNITVGAYCDNFENNSLERISLAGTTPAIYSRTFHYNWSLDIFKDKNSKPHHSKINKMLFKPDIIFHGGDLDNRLDPTITGIKVLSSEIGQYFNKEVGTSYSAPFAANLAAKIIHKYPALKSNMQSVKALIINSSVIVESNRDLKAIESHIIGHGLPMENSALISNDDEITMILEDEILPERIKSFEFKIPSYLIGLEHKNQSIIEISATLCFSFTPNTKSEFTYCPFHLSFIIGNNLPLEDENNGINKNNIERIKVKESWSQDYYYKPKPLSNVQKITQKWTRSNLQKNLENDRILVKLAINSKLHKLLNTIEKTSLINTPIKYSLVFKLKELPYNNFTSGRLYNEISAMNNLENIISIDDLEAEI